MEPFFFYVNFVSLLTIFITQNVVQRANEMILNKSTIPLSDNDKLFLIQGLNFALTLWWNSKTETTEWLNLQSHICKVEWNKRFE